MNLPKLENVIETFIPINFNTQFTAIQNWHIYIQNIRQYVIPLIDELKNKKLIKWYSFLVHTRLNGVPTTANDNKPYFHLRLEVSSAVSNESFINSLPEYCKMTRKPEPLLNEITGISSEYLQNNDNREAWKLIGDFSELVLNIVKSHKNEKEFPIEHVAQFLHFPGNQFLVQLINIPMP